MAQILGVADLSPYKYGPRLGGARMPHTFPRVLCVWWGGVDSLS